MPDLMAARGHLVLIGSTMSFVPMPYASLYSAGKAGLRGFADALRYEVEPLGVHVLFACPPAVDTPMLTGMPERAGLSAGRLVSPEVTAARILRALAANQQELVWGASERFLITLHRLAPRFVHRLLASQRRRFGLAFRPANSL
jgi:short-subunit dehydrogenase